MGLDSFTLDLAAYRDAKLIALAGPNGRGKTTVLDNLQPYPILPSRASGYSLAAFSMYDHVLAPEASKELIWVHAGKTYQTINVWRQTGKSKKAEAYLFESIDGTWQPVRTATGVVSDGKVETYVNALTEIVGSPEVFFSSVFAAQGRRKMFEYKEGEVKDLLAELLNLGDIQEKAALAQKVVSGLKIAADTLSLSLVDAEQTKADLPVAAKLIIDARAQLEQARADVVVVQQRDEDAKAELATKLAMRDQFAHVELQRATLTKRRDENLVLVNERKTAKLVSLEAFDRALKDAQARYREGVVQRGLQRTRIEPHIRQRDQLIAQRDAINNAQQQIAALVQSITGAEAQVALARTRLEEQRKQTGNYAVLEAKLVGARSEYTSAKEALAQIKVKAELAETVPCVGTDLQPRCRLLIDALAAKAGFDVVNTTLTTATAKGGDIKAQLETVKDALEKSGKPGAEILQAEGLLKGYMETRRRAEMLAALQPQLISAETELAEYRQQLATLTAEDRKELDLHEEAARLAVLQREQLSTAPDPAMDRALEAMREAEEALAKLPTAANDGVDAARSKCSHEAEALRKGQAQASAANSTLAFAEAKVSAMDARIAQSAPTVAKRGLVCDELASWQLIAKGLGRDGLIAMLIDEAGPTLAALANDILLACYGRRYSLSIITQTTRANGSTAETFDIIVHDGESDNPKSLKDMSGGQKVWINEALTRAIALYCAQNSQRAFGCLFCDEADGPLDPDSKLAFFAMQREVLKLGGYQKAFFITQTPELVEMADAVINL